MTASVRSSAPLIAGAGGAKQPPNPALIPVLAFVLGLAALALFLWLAGYDALAGLAALWRGSFGSSYAIFSATLVRATPLLVLGLAFAVGARAGGLNIGMEGQFAVGTIAATWTGLAVANFPAPIALPLVLASGLVAGALWILVPVALRLRFGVTEVIATLLLNFVAEAAVSWAVTGPLQEASRSYPQSDPIALVARLPRILPFERMHLGLVLGLLLAIGLAVLFRRSRAGFTLDATGAGPLATQIVGRVAVGRVVAVALLASGALAGLGGAIEVSGVTHALYQRISPGYGFTAIAVALLARLGPMVIVVSAVLFGALEAGAGAMQREAGIPAVAVQVVQAVVILAMVLGVRRRR
jgi:simple sugar transport system permease protein